MADWPTTLPPEDREVTRDRLSRSIQRSQPADAPSTLRPSAPVRAAGKINLTSSWWEESGSPWPPIPIAARGSGEVQDLLERVLKEQGLDSGYGSLDTVAKRYGPDVTRMVGARLRAIYYAQHPDVADRLQQERLRAKAGLVAPRDQPVLAEPKVPAGVVAGLRAPEPRPPILGPPLSRSPMAVLAALIPTLMPGSPPTSQAPRQAIEAPSISVPRGTVGPSGARAAMPEMAMPGRAVEEPTLPGVARAAPPPGVDRPGMPAAPVSSRLAGLPRVLADLLLPRQAEAGDLPAGPGRPAMPEMTQGVMPDRPASPLDALPPAVRDLIRPPARDAAAMPAAPALSRPAATIGQGDMPLPGTGDRIVADAATARPEAGGPDEIAQLEYDPDFKAATSEFQHRYRKWWSLTLDPDWALASPATRQEITDMLLGPE